MSVAEAEWSGPVEWRVVASWGRNRSNASVATLTKRASYGGRKGRRAWRRLLTRVVNIAAYTMTATMAFTSEVTP